MTRHTAKINNLNYFKYWSYLLLTFYAFENAELELFKQMLEKLHAVEIAHWPYVVETHFWKPNFVL